MQYQPDYAFILPLDDDDEKSPEEANVNVDDSETPLTGIDIENPKQPSKKKQKVQVDEPIAEPVKVTFSQNFLKLVWYVIRWHLLAYLIIFGTFYPLFHFVLDVDQKNLILQALAFCDDWKQLIFFFGLYVSFAVKKVSDVSSVSIIKYCLQVTDCYHI